MDDTRLTLICCAGFDADLDAMFGLTYFVLFSAQRVFSPDTTVLASHEKQNKTKNKQTSIDLICSPLI